MKIDSMGANPGAAVHAVRNAKNAKAHKETPSVETTTPPEPPQETENNEEKVRGVIRLLQEGHFKGVADVRLRINFYDEIQALESQHLKSVAATDFESLNRTIQEQIDTLKASGLLSEEQLAALDGFLVDVQQAQGEFLNGTNCSVQDLIDGFRTRLAELAGLLEPPPPVQEQEPDTESEPLTEPSMVPGEPLPVEEPLPLETQENPVEPPENTLAVETPPQTDPLQPLVQAFIDSIQQVIDDLQSGLNETSALPPISESNGNGAAFTKFMEIYESLRTGEASTPPVSDGPILQEPVIPETSDESPQPLSEIV